MKTEVTDKYGKPISSGLHIRTKVGEKIEKATVIGVEHDYRGFQLVYYMSWYSHKCGKAYPADCEVI